MGLIRLLLALAVVGEHARAHRALKFVGGEVAVQAFFIISGFYMAMVIKNYVTAADFWKSRYLRLYPAYIFCGFLSFWLLRGGWSGAQAFLTSPYYPTAGKVYLVFTNLTIFFQDAAMFLDMNGGTLHFTSNYRLSAPEPIVFEFLWLRQAWSLGLELSFYLLVPFVLTRSTRLIVVVMSLSFALRAWLLHLGLAMDPWTYRFFPTELAWFLAGSLAYRVYANSAERPRNASVQYVLFAAAVIYLLCFPFIPLEFNTSKLVFYLILLVALGAIFDLSRRSRVDNFLGLLSYPIYCVHILVLSLLVPQMKFFHVSSGFWDTLLSYLLSAAVAALIYFLIEKPVDRYREKYKRRPVKILT